MYIFRDLWWFFRQEKKSYLLGIFALLAIALLYLFPPYAVKVIVDQLANDALTIGSLWFWSLLCILAGLIRYGLGFIWRVSLFGAANRLGRLLRNRLYNHFTQMSPAFYHQRRTGDLMAHATNDIQAIVSTAGDGVLTLVDSFVTGGLVILTMALFIDGQLTVAAMLPMPVIAWATSKYGSMIHKRFHQSQAAFSAMNDKVQENIAGVRMIKAFGQEKAEIREFGKLMDDVVEKNISVARVDALFDPTILAVVGFSFFLSLAYGSYLVTGGELTIGELTQFMIYLGYLVWPMIAFGFLFNIMERGRASYERVARLLDIKPDIDEVPGAKSDIPTGDLLFQVNEFVYSGNTMPVLKDIHLHLRQGQTLGITGRTGSGKTTLARLLLREFEVTDGQICIGASSINQIKISSLRKAIGYVPQDHVLFSGTVYENIAFAKPDATCAEVERAAKMAAIHDDILRFPEGYETMVGERGVTLSGGQKQRISLARAFLTDPGILVLDDALSAVDARTEHRILQLFRRNFRNKTAIIISHRLSTLEKADTIVVLDRGRIVECGNHSSLMDANSWYKTTYLRQQLAVKDTWGGDEDDPESPDLLS